MDFDYSSLARLVVFCTLARSPPINSALHVVSKTNSVFFFGDLTLETRQREEEDGKDLLNNIEILLIITQLCARV